MISQGDIFTAEQLTNQRCIGEHRSHAHHTWLHPLIVTFPPILIKVVTTCDVFLPQKTTIALACSGY